PAIASSREARPPRERALPAENAEINLSPPKVAKQVGNPGTDDEQAARTIHATIPQTLRESAYKQEQAAPLIFALVLDARADVRASQLAAIETRYDTGVRALVESLAAPIADLHPMLRLPLASLAFPALRRRPRPQLQTFMDALKALIDADGRI